MTSVQCGFRTIESRGVLRSGSLTRSKEARKYLQDRRSERASRTSPDSMEVKGTVSRLLLVDEQYAASETPALPSPVIPGSGRGV